MTGLPGCLLKEKRKTGLLQRAILILNGLNLILRVFSPKAYNVLTPNLIAVIKCLKLHYMCY